MVVLGSCFRRSKNARPECHGTRSRSDRENQFNRNQRKRLTHETRIQKAKEIHKKWKAERKLHSTPTCRGTAAHADRRHDPGNFIDPRLYATDPTIERLARTASGKAARHDAYP